MLLSYLCFIVQNQGAQDPVVPTAPRRPGLRHKTLIAMLLKAVLGPTNVRLTDADQLFRNNGWAEGAQVVAFEEVRVVGHNRHQVMNRLKPVITNDEITIEEKYVKAGQAPNITNYILLTNYQDALALTPDDGRYFVLFARYQTEGAGCRDGEGLLQKTLRCHRPQRPATRHWMLSGPSARSSIPTPTPRTIYRSEDGRRRLHPHRGCDPRGPRRLRQPAHHRGGRRPEGPHRLALGQGHP